MHAVRDGNWTLFDHDLETGRSVWHAVVDGRDVFRIDYPVDAVLDANAEHYANGMGQNWGEGRRVASIPANIAQKHNLIEALAQDDNKHVSRFLNDSDFKGFRTFPGKV